MFECVSVYIHVGVYMLVHMCMKSVFECVSVCMWHVSIMFEPHMSMFALLGGGVRVRAWIREQRKIKRRSKAPHMYSMFECVWCACVWYVCVCMIFVQCVLCAQKT